VGVTLLVVLSCDEATDETDRVSTGVSTLTRLRLLSVTDSCDDDGVLAILSFALSFLALSTVGVAGLFFFFFSYLSIVKPIYITATNDKVYLGPYWKIGKPKLYMSNHWI
jgi:hypothetical protein